MILDFLVPFLSTYGMVALFFGSFASSFIFIPGFTELSTILFLSLNFNPFLIFFFLSLGSILGSLLSYYFGLFGSSLIFKGEQGVESMKKWIEKWGNLSVFAASVLPIPFPFALFGIVAGFLKMDTKSFSIAMIVGKSLRIGISIVILAWGIDLLKFYHILV